jgi:hypothetical protein
MSLRYSRALDLEWLLEYYRKTNTNANWWADRRDTLAYWSLSLVLGTLVAYASFFSPSLLQVPQLYRIALLSFSVLLVYRFFCMSVIAYAWLCKFVTLREQVEIQVFGKTASFDRIQELVDKLDHSGHTTISTTQNIKDQIRSGYWLILGVPALLFILEISRSDIAWIPLLVCLIVLVLIWETGELLIYGPVTKHPGLDKILSRPS